MRMRLFRSRLAGFALCASLVAWCFVPSLLAQDEPPQRGGRGGGMGRGGMFMMGGNSVPGKVAAISGNEIAIKDEQGQSWKVETGPNTRIRKDREEAKISDIHVGATIIAVGNLDEEPNPSAPCSSWCPPPNRSRRWRRCAPTSAKPGPPAKSPPSKTSPSPSSAPIKSARPSPSMRTPPSTRVRAARPPTSPSPTSRSAKCSAPTARCKNGTFLATNLVVMEPRQPGQGRFGNGGPPGSRMGPAAAAPGRSHWIHSPAAAER